MNAKWNVLSSSFTTHFIHSFVVHRYFRSLKGNERAFDMRAHFKQYFDINCKSMKSIGLATNTQSSIYLQQFYETFVNHSTIKYVTLE